MSRARRSCRGDLDASDGRCDHLVDSPEELLAHVPRLVVAHRSWRVRRADLDGKSWKSRCCEPRWDGPHSGPYRISPTRAHEPNFYHAICHRRVEEKKVRVPTGETSDLDEAGCQHIFSPQPSPARCASFRRNRCLAQMSRQRVPLTSLGPTQPILAIFSPGLSLPLQATSISSGWNASVDLPVFDVIAVRVRGLSLRRCQDQWTARTLSTAKAAREAEASLCKRRSSAPPTASVSTAETVRACPPSLRKSPRGPWHRWKGLMRIVLHEKLSHAGQR